MQPYRFGVHSPFFKFLISCISRLKRKKKGGGIGIEILLGMSFLFSDCSGAFCHQVLGLFPWDFDGSVKKLERMKTEDLLRKRDFKMQLIFICSSLDDELHTLQLRY